MIRKFFNKSRTQVALPNLINLQTESWNWLITEGLKELLDEISPVDDFSAKVLSLDFGEHFFDEPKYDESTAKTKNLTYEAPLKCRITLTNKVTKKQKTSDVYLADFPMMTPRGTFIINGIERVVVTQIVRSYGVIFNVEETAGNRYFGAKIIPSRGAWLELETSSRNVISVKIDRKRKIPITAFLRVLGLYSDAEILQRFKDVDYNADHKYINTTLEHDSAKTYDDAMVEVYKRIRPGDLATPQSAKTFLEAMFFNPKRYDLGKVGRYRANKRLGLNADFSLENRILRVDDVVEVIKEIIRLNNNPLSNADDVDNLKNRRLRAVGELIQGRLRVGLLRTERIIKDRMSVLDPQTVVASQLINSRPIQAVIQEFFASSQLSQFMDQTNPLAELEHKRRLAATGPGGLSRERAGFEVRDIHPTHYGRICPIATPEGPNVGLVGHLASYARVNEYGFIETPYFVVEHKGGKSHVTDKVVYLDAQEDEDSFIAPASVDIDEKRCFIKDKTVVRHKNDQRLESTSKIQYADVSPKQIVSVATALIPFVEHDAAERAMMGANMLRQAVPLVKMESPVVGTGMEKEAAKDSDQVIKCQEDGEVQEASADQIIVKNKKSDLKTYHLDKFVRSNQATSINQRPGVIAGQKVKKGEIIADSNSTVDGELALGKNILIAFMSFKGWNYEDAIIISERLLKEDEYTSIHIETYSAEVRDTKLGPEVITRDIPNVGEEALSDLDDRGIIRVGSEVSSGDILVGKITPKGESELSAEEKLLRAIFGEKAKDVKDTSLRLPHGERGKVIDIKIFLKEAGDELPSGVYERAEVTVAKLRKVAVGDKLAGRHGNKGVISKILPVEDMPYLPDGTPVDMILNPLGVVSRMNLGQVMETHLGWAAKLLGFNVASPVFEGVTYGQIQEELVRAGLNKNGKVQLYDGLTGEPFREQTTVGIAYIMKLIHMVDDKMHARSIGPYSMITQQPLGGKAQFGGQRFGEMEVWALEAYGAAHTLQEMLTIKSDDLIGRSKAYEAIIKGQQIQKPQIPASFFVLTRELQSLGLDIELMASKKQIPEVIREKVIEEAVGEEKIKKSIIRTKKAKEEKKEDVVTPEEKDDKELTEFLAGQEENPPIFDEKENKEKDDN